MIKPRSISLDIKYYNNGAGQTGGTGTSGTGAAGTAAAGQAVILSNAPFYYTSTTTKVSSRKSGTFYYYDGKLINGRYRITNSAARCGKLPVGQNVTGWVPIENCTGGSKGAVSAVALGSGKDGTQIGGLIEDFTYVDNSTDNSDSIDITINATDEKWLNQWLPQKGATLTGSVIGRNWEKEGDKKSLQCGLFILDDVNYSDAPSTLKIGGVSKPSNTDFSELEREYTWKGTSVKRIGQTIATRYGLEFSYDAADYDIDCDDQDATDSSYYNAICKKYGLILKVYAGRLWVYDREVYKEKRAVKTFKPGDIKRGSLNYSTTLSGTFTGGYFNYTDPDADCDISCSVGGGTHTKNLSQRASSVYDASVQLCAEINNANHGTEKLKFAVAGNFDICAGNNIQLSGYGKLDGKYFVDKATHKISKSGGFTSTLECSGIGFSYRSYMVGGSIVYQQKEEDSGVSYDSTYQTTSPAAAAASANAGAVAGGTVTLTNAPFYVSSTAKNPASRKSGTFYFYDGILINGRYRITNSAARCGKLPVGKNVTGWVPASYCNGGESPGGGGGGKAVMEIK